MLLSPSAATPPHPTPLHATPPGHRTSPARPSSRTPRRASCASTPTTSTGTGRGTTRFLRCRAPHDAGRGRDACLLASALSAAQRTNAGPAGSRAIACKPGAVCATTSALPAPAPVPPHEPHHLQSTKHTIPCVPAQELRPPAADVGGPRPQAGRPGRHRGGWRPADWPQPGAQWCWVVHACARATACRRVAAACVVCGSPRVLPARRRRRPAARVRKSACPFVCARVRACAPAHMRVPNEINTNHTHQALR